MAAVLSGFSLILILLAIGFFLGKVKVFSPSSVLSLNTFVFYVATPALLIHHVSESSFQDLFGLRPQILILSSLLTGLCAYLCCRSLFRRGQSHSLIFALAASYSNGNHLGIPLSTAILHDPTASIPIILFQVGFYAPFMSILLDFSSYSSSQGRISDRSMSPPQLSHSIIEHILLVLRNPLFLAALAGLILAFLREHWGFIPPNFFMTPIEQLAQAAIPVALVAFGASLAGIQVFSAHSPRAEICTATTMKLLLQPFIALLLALLFFDASSQDILTVTILTALPTAFNVFTYAQRFRSGEVLARDTAAVTTALSAPIIMIFYALQS